MFQQNSNTAGRVVDNASHITTTAWNSIDVMLESIVARLPYVLAGILVLFVFWGASKLFVFIFSSATKRTKLDSRLQILFSRLLSVLIMIVGIFTALTVILPSFQFGDLITGLGFTSFVIGFATKDILNNLFSGVLILWQQPFRIGDYLFVGSNQGVVEYIGVRATSLRKDDGELILIPNGDMYSSALTIRGAGRKRRMNLKIMVGYENDLTQAKSIVSSALADVEGIVPVPAPKTYLSAITSDGVEIASNFWLSTKEQKPLDVYDNAINLITTRLLAEGIELFPQNAMVLQNSSESQSEPKGKKEVM